MQMNSHVNLGLLASTVGLRSMKLTYGKEKARMVLLDGLELNIVGQRLHLEVEMTEEFRFEWHSSNAVGRSF